MKALDRRGLRALAAVVTVCFGDTLRSNRAHPVATMAMLAALGFVHADAATAGNTYIVNTTLDPGPGGTLSLRQAITSANTSAGNTVQFDPALVGSTVTVETNYITISQPMTINGPGPNQLTISGNDATQIFRVTAPSGVVAINGLTLAHGYAAPPLAGGAIAASYTSVAVDNCVISANVSKAGGGIFASRSTVTVSHSRITGNTSTYAGAGISAKCPAISHCANDLTISQSTISGNTAGQWGGGIYAYGLHALTVDQSLVSGNKVTGPIAQRGAGLMLYAVQTPRIINSTITGNYSSNTGGGISADFLYAGFSTIAGNSTKAGNSNGIEAEAGGDIQLQDCIVANNFSSNSTVDLTGTFTANYSLIRVPGAATISGSGSLLGADPMLSPLADHGGPTWTMLPAAASPAVNTGEMFPVVATDQRVLQRPVGTHADMGAVERQSVEDIIFRYAFETF